MSNKRCCVVSANAREDSRIANAIREIGGDRSEFSCDFYNLRDFYEYEGECFCIMHLPFEAKEKNPILFNRTIKCFHSLLKDDKIQQYNFIAAANLSVPEGIDINSISFIGADLWSIAIKPMVSMGELKLDNLSFILTKFRGRNKISDANIKRIEIIDSDCSSELLIESCAVDECLIKNSKFHSNTEYLRSDSHNYKLSLKDSKFNRFAFIGNHCETTLMLDYAEIEELELRGSKFFLCPFFF